MRSAKRVLVLCAAVAIMLTGLAVPAHAGPEGTLLSRINASRAAAGKAPVETYWDLTDDARAHSARMAADGRIYHNPGLSGVTGVWQALGENVGVGSDANGLHDAFMSSSAHRSNILGDFNYVGVGVETDAQGNVWATVIFMKAAPGLNGGGESTTTTVATGPAPETTTTTTTIAASNAPETRTSGITGDSRVKAAADAEVEAPPPGATARASTSTSPKASTGYHGSHGVVAL